MRVPHLGDPPLRFHPTRQYRSAILARGYYADRLNWTEPQRQAARDLAAHLGPIEPPILEHVAAWGYRLVHRETLALPRAISAAAWTGGGLAAWWLAAQTLAPSAALVAPALMMFLPYGIGASQAFQPDPLMTALAVLTLALSTWHARRRSIASIAWLTLSAVAAILVKPMALFFFAPAVLAERAARRSLKDALRAIGWIGFVTLPAAIYYVFYVARVAPDTLEQRFFPQLLAAGSFWRDWAAMIDRVVSLPIFAVAIAGVVVARPAARVPLVAVWVGYASFGLVFAHHIHTHDYYSLPLIPIVALSVTALADRLVSMPLLRTRTRPAALAAAAVFVFGAAAATRAAGVLDRAPDVWEEARRYERIGRLCEHSTRVASLDGAYGYALGYHGIMSPSNLPLSIDLAVRRIAGTTAAPSAPAARLQGADFFVATHRLELDAQPELKSYLDERFPLIDRDGPRDRWQSLVYDLRVSRMTPRPERLTVFIDGAQQIESHQQVRLDGPSTLRWHAVVSRPDLFHLQPEDGTGPATVAIVPNRPAAGIDAFADVAIRMAGYPHPLARFEVRLRSVPRAGTDPPFGRIDSPPDPIALSTGRVVLAGWALDDFDLRRVWAACSTGTHTLVELGDAVRTGDRPDLTAAFPSAHDLANAGWFFTLDAATLRGIADPREIVLFAEDGQGRRAELGRRRLTR